MGKCIHLIQDPVPWRENTGPGENYAGKAKPGVKMIHVWGGNYPPFH